MHFFSSDISVSKNQEIIHPILKEAEVSLFIKREDLIHRYVSGNKFRKLKYNLITAKQLGHHTIVTFGGAYSNHIAAGKIVGLRTIGVIRGEELVKDLSATFSVNDTLRFASESGMQLKFISRAQYKEKNTQPFLETLKSEFGSFYCIPEGGTNELAVQGCEEILTTGIINASLDHQQIIGFPALKGDFLSNEIKKYTNHINWNLINEYHFGGYGKINTSLIEFINMFKKTQHIALDPIYTGKMIYGIFDMIQKGIFTKNTRILAIHTGGLQGISGMNKKLIKKKLPLITV